MEEVNGKKGAYYVSASTQIGLHFMTTSPSASQTESEGSHLASSMTSAVHPLRLFLDLVARLAILTLNPNNPFFPSLRAAGQRRLLPR